MIYFKKLMVYKKYNHGDADTGKYHPSKGKRILKKKTWNPSTLPSPALKL